MGKQQSFKFNFISCEQIEFLKSQYPTAYQEASHFWDSLRKCPQLRPGFPCFFFITDQRNQIVSSLCAYPDLFYCEGNRHSWAWVCNLYTDRACRGKGLASMVIKGSRDILHKKSIALGAVSGNEISLGICDRLKFKLPGYGRRFIMIKSIRPLLKFHLGGKLIVHILDHVYFFFVKLLLKICLTLIPDNDENEVINIESHKNLIPSDFKYIFKFKYRFNNDFERLLWKIECSNSKSENRSSINLIRRKSSGELLCYFVTRYKWQSEPLAGKYKEFSRLSIVDYGFFNTDTKSFVSLVRAIVKIFLNSTAEVLDIVVNCEKFEKILKKFCLIPVGKGEFFVFTLPGGWQMPCDIDRMREWHFTGFTGDMFTF